MELITYLKNICLIIFGTLALVSSDENKTRCAEGLKHFGITFPSGDIYIPYGQNLEIFCILDPDASNYSSSDLRFFQNKDMLPKEFTEVINSTTIRLSIPQPPLSQNTYYCKIVNEKLKDPKIVCLNAVFVGYEPQNVTNFTCISYNWENMKCSWIPQEHFIRTTYNLSFFIDGRKRTLFPCPNETFVDNGCFWNQSTSVIYRQVYDYYIFRLTVKNGLGTKVFKYKVNHYAQVVPAPPQNLSVVDSTVNSLKISWLLPYPLGNFPKKIVHRIEFQAQWDSKTAWQTYNESEIVEEKGSGKTIYTLNITGLKYAHTVYDIRVFLRSKVGVPPYKWSEPASTTLRTKPEVPGMSPKTDIGSFDFGSDYKYELDSDHRAEKEVLIYWQQIPKPMENGENLEYYVKSVKRNGHEVNMHPIEVEKSFAKYRINPYYSYMFKIVSKNNIGYSNPPSEIFVPSIRERPPEPPELKKIVDDKKYKLVWSAPVNNSNIESYTLFWCDNKKEMPYKCTGYLNWTRVPARETHFEISRSGSDAKGWTEFAISANTKTASSGMIWSKCVISGEKGLKNEKITFGGFSNFTPRSVELRWQLECRDSERIVKEFYIHYCPIIITNQDTKEAHCKEEPQKKKVTGTSATLDGLKPYSTYRINVSTVPENLPSFASQMVTLAEDAPDIPPQSISVVNITHSSATLTWLPPEPKNGFIKDYKIYWGNGTITAVENSTSVTLFGLESDQEYNVSMSACTVRCSNQSIVLIFKTKLGDPGRIRAPHIEKVPGSSYENEIVKPKVRISWKLPTERAKNISYFDVMFTVSMSDKIQKSENFTTNVTYYEMNLDCSKFGKNPILTALVRAVRIDENGTHVGPWSDEGREQCEGDAGFSLNIIIPICTIGVLVLIIVCSMLGAGIRRLWQHYKVMQDVEIKLPPNLTSESDKEKDSDYRQLALHVWDPNLQESSIKDLHSPDEQLLLEKKEKDDLLDSSVEEGDDLGENRESSGCGSGHGSVSSSINSTAQISSDSGTEADQRASSPDVFSDSPRQRCLLRQRNVSSSGGGSGEGYCRVAPGPVSGPVYVTMPNTNPSRGYVMHPPLWTPTTEPPPKGYVIAGPPPQQTAPYCQVGWKPSNRDCSFPNQSAINRDRMTDSDGDSQLNTGLNPKSSI